MTPEPDNLVLELLRALRADNMSIRADIAAMRAHIGARLTSIEAALAVLAALEGHQP